jgi:hypothetical protein
MYSSLRRSTDNQSRIAPAKNSATVDGSGTEPNALHQPHRDESAAIDRRGRVIDGMLQTIQDAPSPRMSTIRTKWTSLTFNPETPFRRLRSNGVPNPRDIFQPSRRCW